MSLELVQIAKSHPGRQALFGGLNLKFEFDQLTSLVGPSGCGKSSLLRLIARLDQPSQGRMINDYRKIGFVFQEPRLLPWRNVAENLRLPFELKQQSISHEQCANALQQVQLGLHVLTLFPHQLSGGMKMRVSLARALITEPDLLLMDEPLSALDETTRQILQEEISRIHEKRRVPTLFVTHSLSEALFLSDRIVILGPTGELRHDMRVSFARPRDAALRTQVPFLSMQSELSLEFRKVLAAESEAAT